MAFEFLKSGIEGEGKERKFFGFRLPRPLWSLYDMSQSPERDELLEEGREIAEEGLEERKTLAEDIMLGLLDNEDRITPEIVKRINFDSWFFRSKWLRSRFGLGIMKRLPVFAKAYDFFSEENYERSKGWIAELAAKAADGDKAYEAKLIDSADDLRLIVQYMEGKDDIDWDDVLDKDDSVITPSFTDPDVTSIG